MCMRAVARGEDVDGYLESMVEVLSDDLSDPKDEQEGVLQEIRWFAGEKD